MVALNISNCQGKWTHVCTQVWDPSHRDLSAARRQKKEESRTIALGQRKGQMLTLLICSWPWNATTACCRSNKKKLKPRLGTKWIMMATETSKIAAHSRRAGDATGGNACTKRRSPLWGSCGMASRSSNKKPQCIAEAGHWYAKARPTVHWYSKATIGCRNTIIWRTIWGFL